MFIACKCLNVVIGEEKHSVENLIKSSLCLSQEEQRDPFFKENLGWLNTDSVKLIETSFLKIHQTDGWMIYKCLICKKYTHAVLSSRPHYVLVNTDLITTKDEMERLRKSEHFSPVFNIVLASPLGDQELSRPSPNPHPLTGNLNRKLSKALQVQMDCVEEAVKLYKDNKYAEFEMFRERGHRDHKILSQIFNDMENDENVMKNNINTNSLTFSKNSEYRNDLINRDGISRTPSNRRSFGSNDKMPRSNVNIESYKEDSLDSEGIFDLEGTDLPHNGLNSDVYDSDTDDSVSQDEGIHVRGDSQQWNTSLAKSLPVSVPIFTHFREISQERLDQRGKEPQDIAASIKALARSVHGDVFGDLPRPRFSTQI